MELQHIMSVWIMYFQVASAALFDVGAPRARSGVVFRPVKFTSGGSQSLSPEGFRNSLISLAAANLHLSGVTWKFVKVSPTLLIPGKPTHAHSTMTMVHTIEKHHCKNAQYQWIKKMFLNSPNANILNWWAMKGSCISEVFIFEAPLKPN